MRPFTTCLICDKGIKIGDTYVTVRMAPNYLLKIEENVPYVHKKCWNNDSANLFKAVEMLYINTTI